MTENFSRSKMYLLKKSVCYHCSVSKLILCCQDSFVNTEITGIERDLYLTSNLPLM